jgi:hypothetical protein
MLSRYWRGLPWDGQGWADGCDPVLAALSGEAARAWRHDRAPVLGGALWLASRLLWPLAAAERVVQLARRLEAASPVSLYRDCVRTGATPLEAHVWRSLHGTPHPLPARASALLMARLGDPDARILLADKLAAGTMLSGLGIKVPRTLRLLPRGQPVTFPEQPPWRGPLFVKPRRGYGGRGGLALTEHGEGWLLDGRPASTGAVQGRLSRLAAHDDLLVQDRLLASSDQADLAVEGRAPVLRLVTTRRRKAEPVLHSALLTIPTPDHEPRHFLKGAVHAPIDLTTGRMTRGVSLSDPGNRLERLAWNPAPLAGRRLDGFHQAVEGALVAMGALDLPLVHWDVIQTGAGPVFLEGNTSGNWIIASLPDLDGLSAGSLADVLASWSSP